MSLSPTVFLTNVANVNDPLIKLFPKEPRKVQPVVVACVFANRQCKWTLRLIPDDEEEVAVMIDGVLRPLLLNFLNM
jgi:hypothetical protein